MTRAPASAAPPATPEDLLRKATLARTAGLRAKYAQRGLAHQGAVDRTTRAMLLRQLYLSYMEARRFEDALVIADQMVVLDVMPDVARQDAARACLGLGDRDGAIDHLRLAGRVSPPSRRAFHLWTLGSVLCLSGRPADAVGALERAARWGTVDRPLYLAQLALARRAAGESVGREALEALREQLADEPCGQGYGQFVLGQLAYELGDDDASRQYLRAFVRRATGGRVALAVALDAETTHARRLLSRLRRRRAKAAE
ncbi:MAG: tetratricopeptide repeat protein [Sorangiineae bacterium]|nr:tetratricopeptide repeat protein [Polyangiaceae bacterium]MEB2324119.1 tetratricopeptide repeat protein [Sorangiineae bacterium]